MTRVNTATSVADESVYWGPGLGSASSCRILLDLSLVRGEKESTGYWEVPERGGNVPTTLPMGDDVIPSSTIPGLHPRIPGCTQLGRFIIW
jgi:hypothetical protein